MSLSPNSKPLAAPLATPAFSQLRFGEAVGQGARWVFKRNCSVTPRQMLGFYGSISAISLGIGVWFWTQGATLVLLFSCLEVVALGIAFWVYSRHAVDCELITLADGALEVVWVCGQKEQRAVLNPRWIKVQYPADAASGKFGERGLVALALSGQTWQCGRYVRPEQRAALAKELRLVMAKQAS